MNVVVVNLQHGSIYKDVDSTKSLRNYQNMFRGKKYRIMFSNIFFNGLGNKSY